MPQPDRQVWHGVLAHVRATYPTLARQWFDDLEPLGIHAGTFVVRAHSSLHRDYLARQCLGPFKESLQAVTGHLLALRFLGPEDEIVAPAPPPPARERPRRDDSLVINPDYTFDHFVIGPGNRLAHAAALAVAERPGKAYNPLFIHGGVGLGKTHLLQAICLNIYALSPDAIIYYLSCEGLTTQFFEAVQAGAMSDFRHRFRDVDVLVIDDIHFLAKRERTQEEFFHTFNSLYQASKQIILSSDAAPEEIPDLEERLVSRFKWGLVSRIDPPEFETRVEIVLRKAALRNLTLPNDVASFLAGRINSNIRELEGAITQLQVRAGVEGRPIDLALARETFGDAAARPNEPTIQVIIEAVTGFYGVKLTDLQSKRRQRSIAVPRQVCMFLARKHTRHSLEEIGGYFGGRDHTTVMHAVKTTVSRMSDNPNFGSEVQLIEARLGAGPD